MTTHYFLGCEPTGDTDTGPDGGECFDGWIWAVDPDMPIEQGTNPLELFGVPSVSDAEVLVKVLAQHDALHQALLGHADRQQWGIARLEELLSRLRDDAGDLSDLIDMKYCSDAAELLRQIADGVELCKRLRQALEIT